MKKIIFTLLVFVFVFLIYFFNKSEKIYYLSIGDYLSFGINNLNKVENNYVDNIVKKNKSNLEKYINYSSLDDYRVVDLINDISYNKTIIFDSNHYKLQNLLVKANFITISVGMNDLIYKSKISDELYDYSDELIVDIEKLFKEIRIYNKDKIYFLSFYNVIDNQELIDYLNKKINKICVKYNINYVDISKLDNYIINLYPTNDGYDYITNQIIH
ncbi:MAG: hypothetical protein Q4E75_02400 [bacterium]|nr:hypothetical protein [bacterium]